MLLRKQGRGLALDIAFWQQGLDDPKSSFRGLGTLSQELITKFQALGIISLLAHGDVAQFRDHLKRSALARHTYLKRVHQERRFDDHHFAAGRFNALLSAVAAQDPTSIDALVSLTPVEFHRGREYVDDHCFGRLIGEIAAERFSGKPADPDRLRATLRSFADFVGDAPNARLEACRCLVENDEQHFAVAIEALLDEHQATATKLREAGGLFEVVPYALHQISIVGLALLALAQRKQWNDPGEFKYCPSVARNF